METVWTLFYSENNEGNFLVCARKGIVGISDKNATPLLRLGLASATILVQRLRRMGRGKKHTEETIVISILNRWRLLSSSLD